MMKGYKRNRKTGRIYRINPTKSRIAKRASMKRRGRHLRPAIKMKIKRAVIRARKSHRTKFGRRSLFR